MQELIIGRVYRFEVSNAPVIYYGKIVRFWTGASGRNYADIFFVRKGEHEIHLYNFEKSEIVWDIMPESFKLEDFL